MVNLYVHDVVGIDIAPVRTGTTGVSGQYETVTVTIKSSQGDVSVALFSNKLGLLKQLTMLSEDVVILEPDDGKSGFESERVK